jgi:hypothetical protein
MEYHVIIDPSYVSYFPDFCRRFFIDLDVFHVFV